MPTEDNILDRISALEVTVAGLATNTSVDLKIQQLQDTVGTLLADLAIINEKLDNVIIPEDSRFFLSTEELNFIRDGMGKVSKMMVELENLRDSLLRSAQQAL